MEITTYYTNQSELTSPGRHTDLFADLPSTTPELCRIVQGLVVHYRNKVIKQNEDRLEERHLRYVEKMLARIIELDDRPLNEARPLEKRFVGCCRDFATLFCAMARHKGIPTRVRIGCATYFDPDFNYDHVVAECWNAETQTWHLVDAVLEDRHIAKYSIAFDRYNVPRNQFLVGGLVWQLCRSGQADPRSFGVDPNIQNLRGWWFMGSKLVQDLAALNKRELLLWDYWGIQSRDLSEADYLFLDEVAQMTQRDNRHFDAMRKCYLNEPDLKVPSVIESYRSDGPYLETLLIDEAV